MTDMRLREAFTPWAVTFVVGCIAGYLFNGLSGLYVAASIAPWVGLVLSVLYINHRYWGHPLRFTPEALQR